MARKQLQPPQPELFSNDYNMAVLSLGNGGRGHQYTYGLDAIIKESSGNVTSVVTKKISGRSITEPYTLCSLTSPLDIYPLIDYLDKGISDTRVIVGGQGCYPFLGYKDVVDSIFFGRAEGLADSIITGCVDDYQYKSSSDKITFKIRQARYLLENEKSVGCAGRCKFCQYAATRLKLGKDYSPGTSGYVVNEDRWHDIVPKTGNQTTALDGLSEYTRKKIRKPVSDKMIVAKLEEILSRIEGICRLKVFLILGFPWETVESVKNDLVALSELFGKVRNLGNGKSRIMMMVTTTPFSPEPMTDMEDCAANVEVKWRDILTSDKYKCIIDRPHFNAFFLPQIPGPVLLYKRVAANRILDIDVLRSLSKAKDIDQCISLGGDIFKAGYGYRASKYLTIEEDFD